MEQIIGHEKTRDVLNKFIDEDKIGHAYMFAGKEGIGKKKVAIWFANKAMNQGGIFNETDFRVISPDGNAIKVEQIRNLIEEIYLKPAFSKRKIYIIDDAEKMNDSAQNALLKVLEEPPLYATIILIVAHKEKIIKTILSRIVEIPFDPLSNEELYQIVGKQVDYDFARGSAGKALELLQDDFYGIAEELGKIIKEKDFLTLNKKINELKQSDADIIKVLETLKIIYFKNLRNDMENSVRIIEILNNTMKALSWNANIDLAIDKMMLEICGS